MWPHKKLRFAPRKVGHSPDRHPSAERAGKSGLPPTDPTEPPPDYSQFLMQPSEEFKVWSFKKIVRLVLKRMQDKAGQVSR